MGRYAMAWYFETWLLAATAGVVGCVLGLRLASRHHKESISRKKLFFAGVRYAAILYPLAYLWHAYLQGSRGIGWMSDWFPY